MTHPRHLTFGVTLAPFEKNWKMILILNGLTIRSKNGVRVQKQKCEGDVSENECPSRALSPLYIGL